MLELIAAREARGGPPFDDGARLALCVEGGAMRGVVSAGMVTAIEHLGLLRCFDAVYGSSAGAMNGAYLIAGQAALGTRIYYEDINSRDFIDLFRPLRRRPVMNLAFLVDEVMVRRKRLDVDRVVGSSIPLRVIATDVKTASRHVLSQFTSGAEVRAALRAGATMPVVAGEPFAYRGRLYFDALLTEPIPVRAAEDDGFTHVLALLTRPSGGAPRRLTMVERYGIGRPLARAYPALGARYLARGAAYEEIRAAIAEQHGPARRARVLGIAPAAPAVGQYERRPHLLKEGARRGFEAVAAALTASRESRVAL